MAPITVDGLDVDDVTIDGDVVDEITMDGDVVYQASAIPDSVVDNFEDADGDPLGVYETGETLADYYTLNEGNGSIARTTSNVIEGGHALGRDGSPSGDRITAWSVPGDGLNRYLDEGDKIGVLLRSGLGSLRPGLLFNVEEGASPGAYGAVIDEGNNEIKIVRIADISPSDWSSDFTELAVENVTIADNTWYWCEVQTPSTGDNTIELSVYDADTNGDLSRGSSVGTVSTTDSTHISEPGVGIFYFARADSETSHDWIRVID